jgi:hypothetical protein
MLWYPLGEFKKGVQDLFLQKKHRRNVLRFARRGIKFHHETHETQTNKNEISNEDSTR